MGISQKREFTGSHNLAGSRGSEDVIRKLFVCFFLPSAHWLLSLTGSPLVKGRWPGAPATAGLYLTGLVLQQDSVFLIPRNFNDKFRVASLHE